MAASAFRTEEAGDMAPIGVILLSAVLLATQATSAPRSDGGYTDQMFRDAVAGRLSSAQPFVLVTIADGSTGAAKTGCTEIGALAAALALQQGWARVDDSRLDRLLLTAPDRRFSFARSKELVGSGFFGMEANEPACALLRRGVPAFRADLRGRMVAGTPGHSLGVLPWTPPARPR